VTPGTFLTNQQYFVDVIPLNLEGEFISKLGSEMVSSIIGNVEQVSGCLPGIEDIKRVDETYRCSVRIDVSEFNMGYLSTLSGKLTLWKKESPGEISYVTEGKMAGTKVKIDILIQVETQDSGTLVKWKSEISVGLLAKLLGEDKVNAFLQKTVKEVLDCLKAKL